MRDSGAAHAGAKCASIARLRRDTRNAARIGAGTAGGAARAGAFSTQFRGQHAGQRFQRLCAVRGWRARAIPSPSSISAAAFGVAHGQAHRRSVPPRWPASALRRRAAKSASMPFSFSAQQARAGARRPRSSVAHAAACASWKPPENSSSDRPPSKTRIASRVSSGPNSTQASRNRTRFDACRRSPRSARRPGCRRACADVTSWPAMTKWLVGEAATALVRRRRTVVLVDLAERAGRRVAPASVAPGIGRDGRTDNGRAFRVRRSGAARAASRRLRQAAILRRDCGCCAPNMSFCPACASRACCSAAFIASGNCAISDGAILRQRIHRAGQDQALRARAC